MGLTRRQTITSALGILASGTALATSAWWSRPTSRLHPLAKIEDYWQVSWLGPDALLLTPNPFKVQKLCPVRFDLTTGQRTPLPFLPKGALDPVPSPDGRWVLYKGTEGGQSGTGEGPQSAPKPRVVRWRLVRADGSETHFFPPDGSFRPTPPDMTCHLPYAYWLPDSSGWISAEMDNEGNPTLERFSLDSPKGAPERLVLSDIKHLELNGITTDGRLMFCDYNSQNFQFCEPRSGSHPTPPLRLVLPTGGVSNLIQSPSLVQLDTDGRNALVLVDIYKSGWLGQGPRRAMAPGEFWRIPLDGGTPTCLATALPNHTYFCVSPDHKRVVFVRSDDEQAYLLTLTET